MALESQTLSSLLEIYIGIADEGQGVFQRYLYPKKVDKDKLVQLLGSSEVKEKYNLLTKQNCIGQTALHLAVSANDVGFINLFLDSLSPEQKYNLIRIQDSTGAIPLHNASTLELGKFILSGVAEDAKFNLLTIKHNGNTPVHSAVEKVLPELLHNMLEGLTSEQSFNVLSIKNSQGKTALHQATSVIPKTFEILDSILGGLLPDVKYRLLRIQSGEATPMHLAAERGLADVLLAMVDGLTSEQCFDVLKTQNKQKNTVLHIVSTKKEIQVPMTIQLLLKNVEPELQWK